MSEPGSLTDDERQHGLDNLSQINGALFWIGIIDSMAFKGNFKLLMQTTVPLQPFSEDKDA